MTMMDIARIRHGRALRNQNGVVMLTTLLVMVILAIIGVAAITVSTMENRMAGFLRTGDTASTSAEACLGTGVNVIQQTISNGLVPPALQDNAIPAGPVPAANSVQLYNEIIGKTGFVNFNDALPAAYPNFNLGVPTPVTTLNSFTVQGDIDRLYAQPAQGTGMAQFGGYEGTGGGAAGGGTQILYQINCLAQNPATNSAARVTAIYACTATGGGCQRKI
jgi:hypothetical protein